MRWTLPLIVVLAFVCMVWLTPDGRSSEQSAGDAKARSGSAASLPRPVVDTHELMELFNEPLYNSLRDTLGKPSLNEDQWKTVAEDAHRLAEVANLIAIREEAGEHANWKAVAAEVQQRSRELAEISDARNLARAREQFNTIVANCNTCHMATEPDHAPTLERLTEDRESRP